ncbi:MAG: hypothetical protein PSX36_10610 [bacterium]|nr:hypothetical protein [bacterium]
MPTNNEIVERAELSRQTVRKHIKDYSVHPIFIEQQEKLKFITEKVLTKVFQFAVKGDIRACRLYLECMGKIGGQSNISNTQNNYIQINGLTISQEQIQQLPNEKQKTIRDIIEGRERIIKVIGPSEKMKV